MYQEKIVKFETKESTSQTLLDDYIEEKQKEDKEITEDIKNIQSNEDATTNENSIKNKVNGENINLNEKEDIKRDEGQMENEEIEELKNVISIKLEDITIQNQGSFTQEKQKNEIANINHDLPDFNNLIKISTNPEQASPKNEINISNQNQSLHLKQSEINLGHNSLNLIQNQFIQKYSIPNKEQELLNQKIYLPNQGKDLQNYKQNLSTYKQDISNQNQINNEQNQNVEPTNQVNYIDNVYKKRINFPEKELFFKSFKEQRKVEDLFPKDSILIQIGIKQYQNGQSEYFYQDFITNQVYSVLKKDENK